ncbi:hypothetical protein [Amycolatopsis anabasis]|uniref:hypothetical protein n=1 Tax=Amycolatopsis anabasis TaxID=1840409 RepID=UPI00131E38B9|nr:hypothetical protein [Amycolatopsis anabasis]
MLFAFLLTAVGATTATAGAAQLAPGPRQATNAQAAPGVKSAPAPVANRQHVAQAHAHDLPFSEPPTAWSACPVLIPAGPGAAPDPASNAAPRYVSGGRAPPSRQPVR